MKFDFSARNFQRWPSSLVGAAHCSALQRFLPQSSLRVPPATPDCCNQALERFPQASRIVF